MLARGASRDAGVARGVKAAPFHRLATASPAAVAAALAGVHLTLAALAFDPTPHSGGDNAAYLTLARSLLETGRYLELWDPAAGPHAQYPPGFPALLAVAMALGIDPWTGLKAMLVLISGLAVALSYRWMRARSAPAVALGAGLLIAVSPGIVYESHWILSDVPFWAATMATLYYAARGSAPAAAGFALLALGFRTAGLPLVAAVVLWLALRGRWRWAGGLAAVVVVIGLMWVARASGTDVPYASDLWLRNPYAPDQGTIGPGEVVERMGRNAVTYAFAMLMGTLAGATGVLADIVATALLMLVGVGYARRWARAGRAVDLPELFLPLYVALILAWPEPWTAERFLLPVLPVLLLLAGEGVAALPGSPARTAVGAGGVAILMLMMVPETVSQARWGALCRAAPEFPGPCMEPGLAAFLGVAIWAERRLPEGAVVLSRKPTFFHYFSGVPGRVYPFTRRPEALLEEAEAIGARYVVVDDLGATSQAYLLPALAAAVDRFCILQAIRVEGRDAALLGVLPPEAGDALEGRSHTAPGGAITLDFQICPPTYGRAEGG